MSAIEVQRAAGRYADKARAYKVVVDGTTAGKVKAGEELTVDVQPGTHEVQLRIDWARSRKVQLDVAEGETSTVRCRARSAFGAPLHSLLLLGYDYVIIDEPPKA